jgi:hypothetical protein
MKSASIILLLGIGIAIVEAGKLSAGPHTFEYLLGEDSNFNTNAKVIFLDYDLSKSVIQGLKAQGKTVICYVNVGAWEDWRSDKADFPQSVLGNDYDGWPGEKWLDIRNVNALMPIMTKRFQAAANKGCEGIDPDNMNGYEVDTGFPLSANDQLVYNRAIGLAIRNLGMMAGLKNDGPQAKDLVNSFDFVVSEDCAYYKECTPYQVFIPQNKPVFVIEYTDLWPNTQNFKTQVCPNLGAMKFACILKKRDLKNNFTTVCP